MNEGRNPDAKIKTLHGKASIKEEAFRILKGMQEIADFMDEISPEGKKLWSDNIKCQKDVLDNLEQSLSGTLLKEIQDRNISFQEYGMEVSSAHKSQMNNISIDSEYNFSAISEESISAAEIIEKDIQINFEDYLKDFLSKIS